MRAKTAGKNHTLHVENNFSCAIMLMKYLSCSSPPIDMSSALRSVTLMGTLVLGKMHLKVPKLFLMPAFEENNSTLSPLVDQDTSAEG